MKILSAQQIREADQHTIKNKPIPSIKLMENASLAFTEWFTDTFSKDYSVAIVCGIGNNGGDGLAIGRMLLEQDYNVEVFAVKPKEKTSEDFATNEERLKNLTAIKYIKEESDLLDFNYDIIIDGLFGSGLDRPVDHGIFQKVIHQINASPALKVAIDIASGLFADKSSRGSTVVEADYTISFQVPKLAFFMPENHKYVGEWHLVDIGLDKAFIDGLSSDYQTMEEVEITSFYRSRKKFTHKGNYGRCLLVAGSFGKMGAAVLAAQAALRTGAGLLTIHAPRCGYNILQIAAPEAMVSPDEDEKHFSSQPDLEKYDVIGIGPGLGTHELTLNAYAELLGLWKKPAVIDADGLNLIAKNHHLMDMVKENSILTPHPKEFERIAGETKDHFERLEKLKSFAADHKVYVLLKGYHTAIATPEGKVFFNMTGNPGMATGGTGDVLTGILTTLMAQYQPQEAIMLGVWLHGLAGDKAAEQVGMDSLIASDVIDFIPEAYHHLQGML
ncbi:MAG: NAD(P)H-hydrate dehydratase [Candidatus Cyclobacteriaceae bacterium M2_1C_046]